MLSFYAVPIRIAMEGRKGKFSVCQLNVFDVDRVVTGVERASHTTFLPGEGFGAFLIVQPIDHLLVMQQHEAAAHIAHTIARARSRIGPHPLGLDHFTVRAAQGVHIQGALCVGNLSREGLHRASREGSLRTRYGGILLLPGWQHAEPHVHAFVILAADDCAYYLVLSRFAGSPYRDFL